MHQGGSAGAKYEPNGTKRTKRLCGPQEVSLFSQLPSELLMRVLIEKAKQEGDPALAMVNREYRDNFLKQFEDVLGLRADNIETSSHKAGVLIRNLHRLDKAGREFPTALYLDQPGDKLTDVLSAIPCLTCIHSFEIDGYHNLGSTLSVRCFPNLRGLWLQLSYQTNVDVLRTTLKSMASCCAQLNVLSIQFDKYAPRMLEQNSSTITLSDFRSLIVVHIACLSFQVSIDNMPNLHTFILDSSPQTHVQIRDVPSLHTVYLFRLEELTAIDLTAVENLKVLMILDCTILETLQLPAPAQRNALKCVTMDMHTAKLLPVLPQSCRLRLQNEGTPVTMHAGCMVEHFNGEDPCACSVCKEGIEYILAHTSC